MSKLPTFLKKAQKMIVKILGINSEKDENQYKKNLSIAEGRANTKLKRIDQICKVFDLKIVNNKLSTTQKELLNCIYRESKRLHNHSLAQLQSLYDTETKIIEERISKSKEGEEKYEVEIIADKKSYQKKVAKYISEFKELNEVWVKVGDVFEIRSITNIPSSIKQTVIEQLQQDITSLSSSKSKGLKIGKLKFKMSYDTINLRQYKNSHEIVSKNKIRITKLGKIKVRGTNQFDRLSAPDYANAKLVRKPSGYYLQQTVFINKDNNCSKNQNGGDKNVPTIEKLAVGIDFGIATQLTLSNGVKFKLQLPESRKVKNSQRNFNRKVTALFNKHNIKTDADTPPSDRKLPRKYKGVNFLKLKQKMKKAYEKDTNRKKDVINKVVSYIDKNFGTIGIQDEQIKEWHKTEGYEKAVQYGMTGGIIGKLKKLPTAVILAWFEITTRECSECGAVLPVGSMPPGKSEFVCTECKQVSDRDLHSSIVMSQKTTGKKVPPEWRKLKLLEISEQDILLLGSLTSLIQHRRSHTL